MFSGPAFWGLADVTSIGKRSTPQIQWHWHILYIYFFFVLSEELGIVASSEARFVPLESTVSWATSQVTSGATFFTSVFLGAGFWADATSKETRSAFGDSLIYIFFVLSELGIVSAEVCLSRVFWFVEAPGSWTCTATLVLCFSFPEWLCLFLPLRPVGVILYRSQNCSCCEEVQYTSPRESSFLK